MDPAGTVWGIALEPGERVVFFQRDDPGWHKPALIVLGLLTLFGIVGLFLLLAGLMATPTCQVITTRRFLVFDRTPHQARHEQIAKVVRKMHRGTVIRYELQDVERRPLVSFDTHAAPAIGPLLERWLANRNVFAQAPDVPFEPVRTKRPVVGQPRPMPAALRIGLQAMGGLVAAYGLGVIGIGVALHRGELASAALRARAAELGETHAPLPNEVTMPLRQACSGKLGQGDAGSIVAYVARMDPLMLPILSSDSWYVDRALVGIDERDPVRIGDRRMDENERPRRLAHTLSDALDPTGWTMYLAWAHEGRPQLRTTRYLVAARYSFLELPLLREEGYTPGDGAWGARVLSFPAGEVVCEGYGGVRMPNTVAGTGRGQTQGEADSGAVSRTAELVEFVFTMAVLHTPLHELCRAGGAELCRESGRYVGYSSE